MMKRGVHDYDLFVGGDWTPAKAGGRIQVFNPADNSIVGTVSDATVADALNALEAVHAGQPAWAGTAPRERSEILLRCYELMRARAEDLARLITMENGKSLRDARGEVAYAAEFFRWFSEEAVRIGGELALSPSGNNRILVQHQPVGVALLITPWNFPAAMATRKLGPALAAGCGCILKPATETPLTAFAIAALMAEAGLPKGTVSVVSTSDTPAVVSALMSDPRIRKLSFTGSTQVGRGLLGQAAQQVMKCSMELGGNAPFIVLDDADIEAAADGAMVAKMRNGGEACTAANRFLAHEAVEKEFCRLLADRMGALTVGNGLAPGTHCGPMINADAVRDISALVTDAIEAGAERVTGGRIPDGPGHYYPPTVLRNVPKKAHISNTEIFGPVAPVTAFATEDEAVRMANDTEYGLVSYLYTTDLARGLRVSERLESGMVALNRGLVSDPAAPFGGIKQSGLGREGSSYGIHEFLEVKYIATDW